MPASLEKSNEEYAQMLKIPVSLFEKIIEKFATVSFKSQQRMNLESTESASNQTQYKFIKDKEQTKTLICHIIGITAFLNQGSKFKASHIARVLKKEVSDLKSFF